MSERLPPIAPEARDAEQQRVADLVASGPRGGLRGPFPAWLRSPAIAERAAALGQVLRWETSLPAQLSEMAILVTAHACRARYEWYAHARLARQAGLSEPVIAAIGAGEAPAFGADTAVHAAWQLAAELNETRTCSDETWAAAVAAWGEPGAVELVAICGYYVMVAMTLNVAAIPLPEGESAPWD